MEIEKKMEISPEIQNKLEEKMIEYSPFLASYEQNRVRNKYQNSSFQEIFDDIKVNNNDAILFIMDKYDPLLNSIYTKYKMSPAGKGEYSGSLSVNDWKNEVYLYLSGAGNNRPFYDKFSARLNDAPDDYKWKSFGYYLKHYLANYFNKLINQQNKQIGKETATLNKAVPNSSGNFITHKIDQITSPKYAADEIAKEKPLSNDTLNLLLDKFMLLLKDYADKNMAKGRIMYKTLSLRTSGKTPQEIADLTKIPIATVYKSVLRGRRKWLKFVAAHKRTGEIPNKLEKKKQTNKEQKLFEGIITLSPLPVGAKHNYTDGYVYEKQPNGLWEKTDVQHNEKPPIVISGFWNGKIYGVPEKHIYEIYIDNEKIKLSKEAKNYLKGVLEIRNQEKEIKTKEKDVYSKKNEFAKKLFNAVEYKIKWSIFEIPSDANITMFAKSMGSKIFAGDKLEEFNNIVGDIDFINALKTLFERRKAIEAKIQKRIYISVPYDEKDEAKQYGARWDSDRKKWYFELGHPHPEQFNKWNPQPTNISANDWLSV